MEQLDMAGNMLKRTYMYSVAEALKEKKNPNRATIVCRGRTYIAPIETRIGRNDPCPCGSGRKYKKCCMGKEIRNGRIHNR